MKHILLISYVLIVSSCGSKHSAEVKVQSSEHDIKIINPIIDYCERIHPEIIYPDEYEREVLTVDCINKCMDTGECLPNINLPSIPTQ